MLHFSIPPENVRKPLVCLILLGGIEMKREKEMG